MVHDRVNARAAAAGIEHMVVNGWWEEEEGLGRGRGSVRGGDNKVLGW